MMGKKYKHLSIDRKIKSVRSLVACDVCCLLLMVADISYIPQTQRTCVVYDVVGFKISHFTFTLHFTSCFHICNGIALNHHWGGKSVTPDPSSSLPLLCADATSCDPVMACLASIALVLDHTYPLERHWFWLPVHIMDPNDCHLLKANSNSDFECNWGMPKYPLICHPINSVCHPL
jgi:hypothetical protein